MSPRWPARASPVVQSHPAPAVRRVASEVIRSKTAVQAADGMVQARHPLAAQAGLSVLERGGNAVDAAVAAVIAAGVCFPTGSGLGGGGYLVFHEAAAGITHTIDFASEAPGAAHAATYALDPAGGPGQYGYRRVVDEANTRGWRAIGVPGAVAGLALALERFGTIRFAEALVPAIELADEGFRLGERVALQWVTLWDRITAEPTARPVMTRDGRPYGPADRFRQPTLARTFRRLAEAGPEDFYHGQVARDLAADVQEHDGLLSQEDLARYRARGPQPPLVARYRDATVHAAPGANGSLVVAQILQLLDGFDLTTLDPDGPEAVHLWIEASRLAWADHFQHLADPEAIDVPLRGMTSPAYAAQRRRQIHPERAMPHASAGDPWPYEGRPRPGVSFPPSAPWGDAGTTHVCVVDRQRNLVSVTNTNVGWAGVISPRTGIWQNNAMSWFDPEPGRANSIAPGKRGLNNMSPVVVLRGGRPFAAIGATGGRGIAGTIAPVIAALVDRATPIGEAITMPKVGCDRPDVRLDDRLPAGTIAAIERMGHTLGPLGRPGGAAAGIVVDWHTGLLHGADAPLNEGIAAGYTLGEAPQNGQSLQPADITPDELRND